MPSKKKQQKLYRRKSSRKIRGSSGKGKSPKSKSPRSPKKFRCCVCRKTTPRGETLETTRCRIKGPYYKHAICPNCWWGSETTPGFATEEGSHECPGCKKGVSPVKRTPPKSPPKIIEITDSP